MNNNSEVAALVKTVNVLKRRVQDLQNRRDHAYAVFESMAHLEAIVQERTEELARAKQDMEQRVSERTGELRRKAEELERANDLLREMDRMKTHLLQNVSHELKTPLVSIRGYTELLRARYGLNLTADQHEFLEIVIRNADHLNRVIEDLVQVSQLAKGVSPFDKSVFDFIELVDEIRQELAPYAQAQGVATNWDLVPEPIRVDADRRQYRQMLLNVVSNAIKFSSGCAVREVRVAVRKSSRHLRLVVEDTGIGIPKNKLHRIFERFYQVDPSATRRYGGMGIGLALVQEVVENHGGTMLVESEVNQGTRFVVQLPLTSEVEDRIHNVDVEFPAETDVDVFVVEDQPESALFYHTAIEELGLRVASFTSVNDALAQISRRRPRIVVTDLSMPEMSGIDFIARVRNLHGRGDLQIMPKLVLITARSQDEIFSMGIAATVDSILFKPFSLDALARALGEQASSSPS